MVGIASSEQPDQKRSEELLTAHGLSKRFGPVQALDNVDFALHAGEIHSLMGENGAGKSTLIKCISGVHRPDAGRILFRGRQIAPSSPRAAESLGIATVYQEVNLIPHLSVAENICLGREPLSRIFPGKINWSIVHKRAKRALARLGLELDTSRELGSCSIAIQQLVAIARALDVEARVLILDEPTSSLDRDEVAQLFAVLRRLRSEQLGIIFISHFIDQVFAISDRVTVLGDGRFIGERSVDDLTRQSLISMMIGREFTADSRSSTAKATDDTSARHETAPVMRGTGIARRGSIEHADITIRKGETVGLAGLLGSGRTELARILFGADRPARGHLEIDGRRRRLGRPKSAIARGIGMTTEDRKNEGLIPNLSVLENIELAMQARRGVALLATSVDRFELAERYILELKIKTPSPHTPVAALSGGNQQKVLLARWLATNPRLLILDEPTRGIDVAAKAEILKLIDELRSRGMAILFISSELEEVIQVCDRVIVMKDRRTVAEIEGDALTENAVLTAIAQHVD